MITYTPAYTDKDLMGILDLQKANLKKNLSIEEMKSEGFVTVTHSYKELKKMNDIEKHVIVKEDDKVIAYLLAMTGKSNRDIPILMPMFETFNKISFEGKLIADYHYVVVGQVCVSKGYRGQGILDKAYSKYREELATRYDFAITEIASTNHRSLAAHKRIGFTEIHRHIAPDNGEWIIVIWNWKGMA